MISLTNYDFQGSVAVRSWSNLPSNISIEVIRDPMDSTSRGREFHHHDAYFGEDSWGQNLRYLQALLGKYIYIYI